MSVFNFTVLQAAVTDRDAMRNTDQFPVSEHDPGTQTSVIEDDVNAGFAQTTVKLVRSLLNFFALVISDGADHNGERCDAIGPNDALIVVTLLDGSAQQTRNTDTVAAHLK